MSTRNPFECPILGPGMQSVDVADRIADVKQFDAAQCRAALELPDLQATVRQAIERQLRTLSKRKSAA